MRQQEAGGRPPMPGQIVAEISAETLASAAPVRSPEPAGPRDHLVPACAAGLAILWSVAADHTMLSLALITVCGVGITVCIFAFFVVALALRGGLRDLGRAAKALLVACLLLALAPTLVSNRELRMLNALVMGASCILEYLLLSGCAENVALSLGGCLRAIGFFFTEQFSNTSQLRLLSRGSSGKGRLRSSLLGLLVALVILMVAVPLLFSADPVFADLFGRILGWLDDGLFAWGMRAARFALAFVAGSGMLFGVLHGHGRSVGRLEPRSPLRASASSVGTMLAALDLVYLLFVGVQFAYLFGGASSPAMFGGYAGYARSGFFQLAAVAGINIVVVLASVWVRRDAERSRPVVVLQLVLLASIVVMLASAALRMSLYVGAYVLTILRLLTFVGMVGILALVVYATVWLLRPEFPIFRWAVATLLCIWVAFMLSGPAARVADFNVDGFLAGRVQKMDVYYLGDLSADAIPALERLAAQSPEYAEEARLQIRVLRDGLRLSGWQERSVVEMLELQKPES